MNWERKAVLAYHVRDVAIRVSLSLPAYAGASAFGYGYVLLLILINQGGTVRSPAQFWKSGELNEGIVKIRSATFTVGLEGVRTGSRLNRICFILRRRKRKPELHSELTVTLVRDEQLDETEKAFRGSA